MTSPDFPAGTTNSNPLGTPGETELAPVPTLLALTLETTRSGDAARLDAGSLSLLQYPATEASSGPAGVHLRRRTADGPLSQPLTGPTSGGRLLSDGTILTVHGPLEARTRLQVVAEGDAWVWTIHLRHLGGTPLELDLLHTLDIALTEQEAVRRNEQYVAQYLDLAPVVLPAEGEHAASLALAVRQNMPGPTAPWAALGASSPVLEWGTDALQLLDRRTGEGLDPARDLLSERLQHEHTLAALRTAPITLEPGREWSGSFWGFALADHPAATGAEDAQLIRQLQQRIEASLEMPVLGTSGEDGAAVPVSLLAAAPVLAVQEADPTQCEEFAGGELRLVEEDGRLLSAFSDHGHLVTAAKERLVLRPHGHIQQVHGSGDADLDTVASTVWMRGVFCSQLTLGHASTGALITVRRSYLGLDRTGGVRLLLRTADGGWSLLSTPSLWRTDGASSQWLYLTGELTVKVSSEVVRGMGATVDVEISGEVARGAELLAVVGTESEDLALEVAVDGCPVAVGGDSALFADGTDHGTGLRTVRLDMSRGARLWLRHRGVTGSESDATSGSGASGDLDASSGKYQQAVSVPSAPAADAPGPGLDAETSSAPYRPRLPVLRGGGEEAAAVGETLSWLAQNASIHFRSPRGLEQYSGGAWGTRDVCQGPVGLLLATDEPAALRRTLLTVLAAQQEDGTWPQWFDYLPGYTAPGLRDAHGDVVYWPLLALGEYLTVTGDHDLLEETAPWVGAQAMGEPSTVLDHLTRAFDHIAGQRTDDPRLPAYGHGDWNDSLQPARPELAEHMCSTWTTELEIKALTVLADALAADPAGRGDALGERCRALVDGTEEGLREHLLVGGELSGYAILDGGQVQHLVHPSDTTTGVRHGALQMIHALADELLTPAEARHHLDLLREHLAGPTGIYLFDRPIGYHGGEMRIFQRAEAATFWGREVGLMYMHAHLRWIEALTHLGETELAWTELLKSVPIGLGQRVRGARPRQANCYFSSSDAVFPTRYAASENPEALFSESTGFEGGWRIYSSGPGLLLRIIVEDLLGIRRRARVLHVDPVLPAALDGIEAEIPYDGGSLTVRLHRGATGSGVRELRVDGKVVEGAPLTARYREAGIAVPVEQVRAGAVLEVQLG